MKIALIKGTDVDNVIAADESFLEHADPRWKELFTEFHLLDDSVRVAGGFVLSEPRGPGVHDLREESAEALQALYLEPVLVEEQEPEIVTEPADDR
jgi:hypothetical protein